MASIAKKLKTDPQKPPHGAPCNSCGLCCKAELCPLGAHIFGEYEGPCPALEREPENVTYRCGLVARPALYAPILTALHGMQRLSEAALLLIGHGVGCDARIHGETENREFLVKLAAVRDRTRAKVKAAKRLWGAME